MTQPYVLSIETDQGTYLHGYHLGTQEKLAREIAVSAWHNLIPNQGRYIRTVALKQNGRIVDVYMGQQWESDYSSTIYNDEAFL